MKWRRLGWAGLELEAGGETLVIDHLLDPGMLKHFFTDERDELITPDAGRARAALVTHLHRDHADVEAIEAAVAPDAVVLRPPRKRAETALDEVATGEADAAFAASALTTQSQAAGDVLESGPFTITALVASDALGSPQVSWLVQAEGRTVLHGGDTMWHAAWWDIPALHGAVDVAWLPGNGAELAYPQWAPPAAIPGVMTPEQSVAAARALRAKVLAPIHYNRMFEHPEYYKPVAGARELITERAARDGLEVCFASIGDWHEVA